jgi:hypothetical protein
LWETDASQITLAKDAAPEDLEKAKQQVKDQGGKIVHEFTLIKGFTYVLTLFLLLMKMLTPRTELRSRMIASQHSRPTTRSPSRRTPKSRPNRAITEADMGHDVGISMHNGYGIAWH